LVSSFRISDNIMMRLTRHMTGLTLTLGFMLCFAMNATAVAQQDAPPIDNPDLPVATPTDIPPGPPGDGRRGEKRRPGTGSDLDGQPRIHDRGGAQRMMMARRWRNPSPEDIALFIKVAGDLNPEWRDSLLKLQSEDAEGLNQAIATYGRRLWQLVELRERNPKLYQLRLEEVRTQDKLRELAGQYRDSVEAGPSAESERLLLELEKLALFQVDLQLRVRGEELAAMDEALKRLRVELLTQLEDRDDRAKALVERLIEPRAEGEHGERPDDRLRQRPGAGNRGRGGRDDHAAPPAQGTS
jgi:hypothetical protein